MQALQSSTAWKSGDRSGQFVALRRVAKAMSLVDENIAAAGGVADGAGLAHDVGNLLGALSLYSDLLALPGVLRDEHRSYAAELRLLSERSRAMLDRLVLHAQTERAAWNKAGGTVLPEVVERCRGLLGRVAGSVVEVNYDAAAFRPVNVSVESLERILTNLVKNAAESMSRSGAVVVSVEGQGKRVVLTVRDRGCGMNAATVQALTEGVGIASAGGRGLGFRVVRELVAMSGGCLGIESEIGVGTSISAEWYAAEHLREQTATSAAEKDARRRAC